MVQTGHMSPITQMRYLVPDPRGQRVETLTFERLRLMNDGGTQRADFHVLAFIDAGTGAVTVDFVQHHLSPGAAVWIAPGAVHRWEDVEELSGRLVLFVPTAPVTDASRALAAASGRQSAWIVAPDERPFVGAALDHLVLESSSETTDGAEELPAILLSALLARLRPPEEGPGVDNPLFLAFRALVEADFRVHHDAEHYARALGYAPRTLSRAVKRATGLTAKAYLLERIALEAKRLLAHERLTSATCAAALGFTDASNFSVFFRGATGERPGAWQKSAVGAVL